MAISVLFVMLLAPPVLASPNVGQTAMEWFVLYLPFVLAIIAIIALILYANKLEKKDDRPKGDE